MGRLFLTLCFLLGFTQATEALEITFKQNGSVEGSVIKLGDIASFDEETEMAKALATQVVGQAPAPGEKVLLRSQNIRHYFLANHSIPQDTRWKGSPTVSVLRDGVVIGPDRVQTIIAEYIQANTIHLPAAEIRFIPASLPLPFNLPKGHLSHEVIPSNPSILGSSRFSIIFRVDNKVVKNMSVRGQLEALAQVIVTASPLKKGQIIVPQMLTAAIMDISKVADAGLDPENFIGKKLKRSLRTGSPILTSMVEALPIIRRGERVKIVVNSGNLLLTATGLAHSDGKQDQMIRVQNINSNKMVYCRVAAPGLVEVML